MKHLKKFNENKILDDAIDLSNNYLAYLKDDGFKISIERYSKNIQIRLSKPSKITTHYPFTWDDVKDSYIPFIEIILQNYNIKNNIVYMNIIDVNKNLLQEYSIDDIVNDNITDELITNIVVVINKK